MKKLGPLLMLCINGYWLIGRKCRMGSGMAKALDYSLKRWKAPTRYLDDGAGP